MVNQAQVDAAMAFQGIKFEESFGEEIMSHKIVFLHLLMSKMDAETYDEFLRKFLTD